MATAAAVIAVVSLAVSEKRSHDARGEQRDADRMTKKMADLKNAKQRRKVVAEGRRLRAQTEAQGEAQGISGGSQVAGAAGSADTQTNAGLAFLSELKTLDANRFSHIGNAQKFAGQAKTFSNISALATTFAGMEQKPTTGTPKVGAAGATGAGGTKPTFFNAINQNVG